ADGFSSRDPLFRSSILESNRNGPGQYALFRFELGNEVCHPTLLLNKPAPVLYMIRAIFQQCSPAWILPLTRQSNARPIWSSATFDSPTTSFFALGNPRPVIQPDIYGDSQFADKSHVNSLFSQIGKNTSNEDGSRLSPYSK
ncbi:14977_t:CDS:2, partial [Acaulospora colombiana]